MFAFWKCESDVTVATFLKLRWVASRTWLVRIIKCRISINQMSITLNANRKLNIENLFVDNVVLNQIAQKIHPGKFPQKRPIYNRNYPLGGSRQHVKNGLILIHHTQHKHQPIRQHLLTIIKLLLRIIKPPLIIIKHHQRHKRAIILHRHIRNNKLASCGHIYKIAVRVGTFSKLVKIQFLILDKRAS